MILVQSNSFEMTECRQFILVAVSWVYSAWMDDCLILQNHSSSWLRTHAAIRLRNNARVTKVYFEHKSEWSDRTWLQNKNATNWISLCCYFDVVGEGCVARWGNNALIRTWKIDMAEPAWYVRLKTPCVYWLYNDIHLPNSCNVIHLIDTAENVVILARLRF